MVMTVKEIEDWREKERERLPSLHMTLSQELCKNTIDTLTTVLQDD